MRTEVAPGRQFIKMSTESSSASAVGHYIFKDGVPLPKHADIVFNEIFFKLRCYCLRKIS